MEYEGSVYIGVVGSEFELGTARDSIQAIERRYGDSQIYFARGTKGIETREAHLNKFLDSHHDFILMLDGDMYFPPDILEKLRRHKKPYVSGIYMRRQIDPITPIWFKPGKPFPKELFLDFPDLTDGILYELGASGWGCILMHRDVVLAVKGLLMGEPLVYEAPMELYPYDLGLIMSCLNQLNKLVASEESYEILRPAYTAYIEALTDEIRPLRGLKTNIGSDIRFPHYARLAGFKLYGDPNAQCGHYIQYPLSFSDYLGLPPENLQMFKEDHAKRLKAGRKEIRDRLRELKNK